MDRYSIRQVSQTPMIRFVPSSKPNTTATKNPVNETALDGDASEIYKSIVLTPSLSPSTCSVIPPKCSPKQQSSSSNLKREDIFAICQNGQRSKCEQWLSCGFDVNTKDTFHWNPLMVAACAGHVSIVKILLDAGADPKVKCPGKGKTAAQLAQLHHHWEVVKLLRDFTPSSSSTSSNSLNEQPAFVSKCDQNTLKTPSFECASCGPITGTFSQHESSIAHQIKSQQTISQKAIGNYAQINRDLKGYQLLIKEGWNGRSGLGAREDGRRYPLKAKKKPDRACIGAPEPKPSNTEAEIPKRFKLKYQLRREERRVKRLEAEFRQSFR